MAVVICLVWFILPLVGGIGWMFQGEVLASVLCFAFAASYWLVALDVPQKVHEYRMKKHPVQEAVPESVRFEDRFEALLDVEQLLAEKPRTR